MIKRILNNNSGFKWITTNNVSFKGFFFDANNKYYNKEKACEYFNKIETLNELKKVLGHINGFFSLIVSTKDYLFVVTDRLKSYPIFYYTKNNEFIVSDEISSINVNYFSPDDIAKTEFIHSNYTFFNRTLFKEIKQLTNSSILCINNKTTEIEVIKYYYHFNDKKDERLTLDEDFLNKVSNISDRIIERLIISLEGRTILLSLSGGYDSRYIAVLLKKIDYKNVICFTYGSKNSFEVKISEQVAKRLNFEWKFIEYNDKILNGFSNDSFSKYFLKVSNYSTLPHYQDYFALKTLSNDSSIPANSIIVTGFSGDLLGGSKFENFKKNNYSEKHFFNEIFDREIKFYSKLSGGDSNLVKDFKLEMNIDNIRDYNIDSLYEQWFLNNKVSKFVINPNRNYEYFGFEWRMPLWDNELSEFWYTIPDKLRENSLAYNKFLEKLFLEYNVNYKKSNNVKKIQRVLPIPIYKALKVIYYRLFKKKVDFNNYTSLIKEFTNSIKTVDYFKKINSMNANRYLTYIFAVWFIQEFVPKQNNKNN